MEHSLWWFIGAIVLGIAQVFTLDLVLLMLAAGALVAGVAALLGAPWWLSIILFCVVSTLLLIFLRPYLVETLRKSGKQLEETNAAALPGKQALAIDDVTATAGRIKLVGEVWTARTAAGVEAIPEGATVTVIEIRGATAIVAPVKEQ